MPQIEEPAPEPAPEPEVKEEVKKDTPLPEWVKLSRERRSR